MPRAVSNLPDLVASLGELRPVSGRVVSRELGASTLKIVNLFLSSFYKQNIFRRNETGFLSVKIFCSFTLCKRLQFSLILMV